jgi:hypothetical protein
MLTSLLIGNRWFAGPDAVETGMDQNTISDDEGVNKRPANGRPQGGNSVDSPAVPESHQYYLRALQEKGNFSFQDQTADACFRIVSQTLGIEIELHDSVRRRISPEGRIKLSTTEPVSHQTAIRLVMQHFSLYDCGIVFGENEITLVNGADYNGPSLRTYDYAHRTDYSLAERRRYIELTLSEVHPDHNKSHRNGWVVASNQELPAMPRSGTRCSAKRVQLRTVARSSGSSRVV